MGWHPLTKILILRCALFEDGGHPVLCQSVCQAVSHLGAGAQPWDSCEPCCWVTPFPGGSRDAAVAGLTRDDGEQSQPKGKAFLLGQSHSLGDGGCRSVLAGAGCVLRAGAAGSGSWAKQESLLWSCLNPACRGGCCCFFFQSLATEMVSFVSSEARAVVFLRDELLGRSGSTP